MPTREAPQARQARSKACRSCLLLSSCCSAHCRRLAASLAPGPNWESRSRRQRAFARTMVTLRALLVSPIQLPWYCLPTFGPAHSRHPRLSKGEHQLVQMRGDIPQGPATRSPSSNVFVYLCMKHFIMSVLISVDQELSENVWFVWSKTSY